MYKHTIKVINVNIVQSNIFRDFTCYTFDNYYLYCIADLPPEIYIMSLMSLYKHILPLASEAMGKGTVSSTLPRVWRWTVRTTSLWQTGAIPGYRLVLCGYSRIQVSTLGQFQDTGQHSGAGYRSVLWGSSRIQVSTLGQFQDTL